MEYNLNEVLINKQELPGLPFAICCYIILFWRQLCAENNNTRVYGGIVEAIVILKIIINMNHLDEI